MSHDSHTIAIIKALVCPLASLSCDSLGGASFQSLCNTTPIASWIPAHLTSEDHLLPTALSLWGLTCHTQGVPAMPYNTLCGPHC